MKKVNGSGTHGKPSRNGARTLPAEATTRKTETAASVTHEQIRDFAYCLYVREGRPHGCHMQHWLRAETQLMGKPRQDDPVSKAAGKSQIQGA